MRGGVLRNLLRDQRGASALETALFAPVLVLGLLGMADVGLAVGVRMELDRVVRSGAQAALTLDNGAVGIRALALATSAAPAGLEVEVALTCSCAGAAASCTATCGAGAPSVYYDIAATRRHDGFLFGEREIASSTRVKIR